MVSIRGSIAKSMICMINTLIMIISLSMILFGLQMKIQQQLKPPSDELALVQNLNINTTENGQNNTVISHNIDDEIALFGIIKWKQLSNILIIIGFILFIITIFSFCSILSESLLMMNIYIYFLTILFITLSILIVLIIIFNRPLIEFMKHIFVKKIQSISKQTNYDDDGKKSLINNILFVQNFQQIFQCCGIDSVNDWHNKNFANISLGNDYLPSSCCSSLLINEQQQQNLSINGFYFSANGLNICHKNDSNKFIVNHVGCFSDKQIFFYRLFSVLIFIIIITAILLIISLTCCIERDKHYQLSYLLNKQYAQHISGYHHQYGNQSNCPFARKNNFVDQYFNQQSAFRHQQQSQLKAPSNANL